MENMIKVNGSLALCPLHPFCLPTNREILLTFTILFNNIMLAGTRALYKPPPCPQIENTLSTYDPHALIVVYSVDDRESFQERNSNEGS